MSKFSMFGLLFMLAALFHFGESQSVTATVECGSSCKAGQASTLTLALPTNMNIGSATTLNIADLVLKVNVPINATIPTGTQCYLYEGAQTDHFAYVDSVVRDNTYTSWGFLTATNYILQTFMPAGTQTTVDFTKANRLVCNYNNAPYVMITSYTGVLVAHAAQAATVKYNADITGFPLVAVNALTGTFSPNPLYQNTNGELILLFQNIPTPIREYDVVTINIPVLSGKPLFLWNSMREASCTFAGRALEYVVQPESEPTKLQFITPVSIDNNEGIVEIKCKYTETVVESDDGVTKYNFPNLPSKSTYDAIGSTDLTTTINVSSLPDFETSATVTRYEGTVTWVPTQIPILGTSISVLASAPVVGQASEYLYTVTPLIPSISANDILVIGYPASYDLTNANCRVGFNGIVYNALETTVTHTVDGSSLRLTLPNSIASTSASGQAFRVVCKDITVNAETVLTPATMTLVRGTATIGESTVRYAAVSSTNSSSEDIVLLKVSFDYTRVFSSHELYTMSNSIAGVLQSNSVSVFKQTQMSSSTVAVWFQVTRTNTKLASEIFATMQSSQNAIVASLAAATNINVSTASNELVSKDASCFYASCGTESCGNQCPSGIACTYGGQCTTNVCTSGSCAATQTVKKNTASTANLYVGMGVVLATTIAVLIM